MDSKTQARIKELSEKVDAALSGVADAKTLAEKAAAAEAWANAKEELDQFVEEVKQSTKEDE